MQRILIIGRPAAGKSTLAAELGHRLDLPVYHLDRYYWQPGWIESDLNTWRRWVTELVAEDSWIMDGNFFSTQDIRFPRADTIINLDFSASVCLWRAIRRIVRYYGRTRPDLAVGCPERFDWSFLKWVLRFRRDNHPVNLRSIDRFFRGDTVITLRTPKDTRRYLADM